MKYFLVLLALLFSVNAEEKVKFEDLKTINPDFQKLWTVKDGIITGGDGKTKVKRNTFLCTKKQYGDCLNISFILLKTNNVG